jgi:hypothetical protein
MPASTGKRKPHVGLFKPGQSGNPKGRPPGKPDWRNAVRAQIEARSPELLAKAFDLALSENNGTVLRMLFDRIAPAARATDIYPAVALSGPITKQSAAILAALSRHEINLSEASDLMQLVEAQARTVETVEFAERLKRIEERLGIRAAEDNGHEKPPVQEGGTASCYAHH